MIKSISKLLPLALAFVQISHAQIGANIDESLVQKTITVDQNGRGDYRTFGEAMQYLNENPKKAIKVVVKPGIYRENIVPVRRRTAELTIIEGTESGKVILSGADVWTDWNREANGLYSKRWPFDWGTAKYDDNYHIKDDLGRRCEIVLWDGDRMQQVASQDAVTDGCYFVDEENDRLWLKPPTNKSIRDGVIEVSVRTQLIWLRSLNNLVLRNLKVVNAASGPQHNGKGFTVAIFGNDPNRAMRDLENMTEGLLIDNCEFSGNNSSGVTISNYRYVSILNSRFNDNGNAGAGPSRLRYMEVVNCEFNRNNWRLGGYGKFYDWAPSGVKFFESSDFVIRDSEFNDNLAPGLWLDWQHENCLVDNVVANRNAGPGLYIEASIGPFVITNSEFKDNGKLTYHGANHGGVLIAESQNVLVANCVIENNSHSAIMIRTRDREDCGGYWSGKRFGGTVKNVYLAKNTMRGRSYLPDESVRIEWYEKPGVVKGGLIMDTTFSKPELYATEFLTTLKSDGNIFSHEDTEAVFSIGENYGFRRITLKDWQGRYGLDLNSTWE